MEILHARSGKNTMSEFQTHLASNSRLLSRKRSAGTNICQVKVNKIPLLQFATEKEVSRFDISMHYPLETGIPVIRYPGLPVSNRNQKLTR